MWYILWALGIMLACFLGGANAIRLEKSQNAETSQS